MRGHIVIIQTRTPGPVKVAVCQSCGWESNPHATTIRAIKERSEHLAARPTPHAGEGAES